MRDTFSRLEPEIRRVAKLAEGMGLRLSIVSRMLILQGEGTLVIAPMPRNYADWYQFGDWQLYELVYSRSYRRRSTDYGEKKSLAAKSSTRKEIYARWDKESREREESRERGLNMAERLREMDRLQERHQVEVAQYLLERMKRV